MKTLFCLLSLFLCTCHILILIYIFLMNGKDINY